MRAIGLGLLGLLVAGCVTARPPLPDAAYVQVAKDWVVPMRCTQIGAMDAPTAATAQQLVQESLQNWAVDQARLNGVIAEFHQYSVNSPPPQDVCASFAVRIHAKAQDREGDIAYARQVREEQARLINTTRTRGAFCNHLGGQTFCSSY